MSAPSLVISAADPAAASSAVAARRARTPLEVAEYVATGVGMALACSGYAMLGEIRGWLHGRWLLAAIGLGGLLCVGIALSVAELASIYPSAPGVRTYLRRAFGDRLSLAFTFMTFGVLALFAGVESSVFIASVRPLLGSVHEVLVMTALVVVLVVINVAGVDLPRRTQLVLTALAVLLVIGLSLGALVWLPGGAAPAVQPAATPDIGAFASGVGTAIFLYTGFEWVTPLGRSPGAYRRRVPWSMPIALVVLATLFALLAAAADRATLTGDAARAAPHVALGQATLGLWGARGMMLVSALSIFTTFNAGLMGASRLVYALAREGRLPAFAARLSRRSGVPIGGVLLVAALAWAGQMIEWRFRLHEAAALACAALYCMLYAGFVAACIRLRRLSPTLARPFRNRLPRVAQGGLCVALVLVGLAALVAEPRLRVGAIVLFVVTLVAAGSLALWVTSRGSPSAARRAAPSVQREEARL